MEQLILPFNFEPCQNHHARLIADDMVLSGDCNNWDHAYECAWYSIEEDNAN
jgi:hypothetical protein